jgi:N-acetylglucosamine-6-phosphate deacetylase
MLHIQHASLYTPIVHLGDASLLLQEGIIAAVGTAGSLSVPSGTPEIDASGKILVPGFIDLQLNGAFGDDFTSNPETIWRVAEKLPRFGVTSFLPTLVTCPLERASEAMRVLKNRPPDFRGAEPLGLHLEGPFLNPSKKGAHNPAYLRQPSSDEVAGWSRENGVLLVTLAPELPNALSLVEDLATRGIIVSMGHTMATVDEANAGYSAGIRYATHLFNAMPPLEHRAPNAPGAVLANCDWVAGLIADGIHLHPVLVKTIWNAKGTNINLVTDAMAALGMPPGVYRLNDYDVRVTDRDARLLDGTLAGSILSLDRGVRNFIAYTGCSLSDALATVTTTPARLLNIHHARGSIAQGMVADLTLLNPDLTIHATIVAGEFIYQAESVTG